MSCSTRGKAITSSVRRMPSRSTLGSRARRTSSHRCCCARDAPSCSSSSATTLTPSLSDSVCRMVIHRRTPLDASSISSRRRRRRKSSNEGFRSASCIRSSRNFVSPSSSSGSTRRVPQLAPSQPAGGLAGEGTMYPSPPSRASNWKWKWRECTRGRGVTLNTDLNPMPLLPIKLASAACLVDSPIEHSARTLRAEKPISLLSKATSHPSGGSWMHSCGTTCAG